MAKAYAHMGVGSHEQVLHFVHQRISELGTASREAKDELDMWRTVVGRADLSHALRAFVLARIADLGAPNGEKVLMDELLTLLNPCPACNGYGETREFIAQDETRMHRCSSCGGSGKKATP